MFSGMTIGHTFQKQTTISPDAKLIAGWLLVVAALVFSMVILGGVTRLTNSGLSMVDWKPVTGWLPPIGLEAWDAEFEKYKAFPEYQKINRGMSLSEFKDIFAFEYSHRLLGRTIGLAFFVPFLIFLLLKKIPRPMIPRLLVRFVRGGSQGVMGWVMVKSGLVDHPDVSHYRLTAHLALACLIFVALIWTALDLLKPKQGTNTVSSAALMKWSKLVFGLVFFQILIGGFVAGLNGGLIYNEWPMMGEGFFPEELFDLSPFYMNLIENHVTVQFFHRMTAYAVLISVFGLYLSSRKSGISDQISLGSFSLLIVTLLQLALGIWTLLAVVPVTLGALHQAGGLTVLGISTFLLHGLGREK